MIFGMSMWNCVRDVMGALLELVIYVVASNGKYVDPCLDMLVNNFMPPMESHMLRNACVQAIKEQVLPRVHTGLEVIVDLVPMVAINLSTTVVQKRPMFFRKDFNTDHLKCHVAIGWDEMLRDDLCKGIFTMELEDEDEVADDDGQANNDASKYINSQ